MKTIASNWKYLRYLVWLGPVLMIMGLTAGVVANSWGAVPLGLVLAGIVVLVVMLALEGSIQEGSIQGFFGRRSTQVGTNALIATIAVLVILGLVNVLAIRYSSRLDLTENKIFTLAPQSQQVVHELRQPVKIWIFDLMPNPADKELLENYRRQNSQFSYEYVDPQAQPGIARAFEVKAPGEVYVESGKQRRFLQVINDQQRLSERRLTNGVAQIAQEGQVKVYFLQGHGERPLQEGQGGLSQLRSRLGEENYLIQPLDLATTAQVPTDASVVVVAGPKRSLLEAEVKALEDYLKRRSGLMLLIDPQTNPELGNLLKDWGVGFSDRIIVDPAGQAAGLGAVVALVNQYGQHPITQDFKNGISFFPVSRPLEVKPVKGVQVAPLLLTDNRTQAQRIEANGQLAYDPATDPKGPFTLGVALSRPVSATTAPGQTNPSPSPAPTTSPTPTAVTTPSPSPSASPSPDAQAEPALPSEARMVVIGNSTFVTDGLVNQQLNGDVFLNSVNWLSQQGDQILSIRPREMTNRRIILKENQPVFIVLLSLVFLPLLGFVMGFLLWWRRR
jgi:ABC-type uncharacterized transport system involved in gliding motility auxiliary subunit